MAIRNFYIEGKIDGRSTYLSGGPKAKEGGMRLYLMQRHLGSAVVVAEITCSAQDDGKLVTVIEATSNEIVVEEEVGTLILETIKD